MHVQEMLSGKRTRIWGSLSGCGYFGASPVSNILLIVMKKRTDAEKGYCLREADT